MKIAVIGAGMIGVSIAVETAARGAEVTLIDKSAPGSGTSAVSYAWVNSNGKEPTGYYELNRAGLEAHYRLADGGADWFRPTGHIEIATAPEHTTELRHRLKRLEELGYEATSISGTTASALIPDLIVPENLEAAAYFPREAHVYPSLYIRHQLRRAEQLGVTLRTGATVAAFHEADDGVKITLSDGSSLSADRVISAAGRWTNDITAAAGLGPVVAEYQEPGDVTVGYLAVTNPLPAAIDRMLTSPRLNIRPAGGGRLLLQALDLDVTAAAETTPGTNSDLAKEFVGRLQSILKNTTNAHITELDVGVRAMPADGQSVIGGVPSRPWLYLVATHSGVTLAPFLGTAVAAEVLGEIEPLLNDFRPTRLLDSYPQHALTAPRQPGQQ
ncbi:FAD-binding oxidoreductase [Paenarthrobacter sp. YJN-5]|uniref:NAD(P)/FAD-dependent oxidoreductase n=1 Tax=Paenarthrobacter sp. YJN-5 TaxID=2735316 RepID=UPI001877ABFD|nr:FAD-dependent oxidoreductase [Paenarthrobacter sp. YJN-5]QOT19877.1 FAD-binding oxidoreductase [Paenarthrobacter sp. YJN-5]